MGVGVRTRWTSPVDLVAHPGRVCMGGRCCHPHARYGGLPRSRSVIAWRTVLWVVLHVRSRPWVVSGREVGSGNEFGGQRATCSGNTSKFGLQAKLA